MIFVVLGTQKFQLNRLLMQIDEEIKQGLITEEIFAQIGHSDYKPQNFQYGTFLDKEVFEAKITEARMVIAHSGVGTIMTALNAQKPVLVFPRLAKYKEHVDDHQLDIARAFAKKNYVSCYEEGVCLGEMIAQCMNHKYNVYVSQQSEIIKMIRSFIQQ